MFKEKRLVYQHENHEVNEQQQEKAIVLEPVDFEGKANRLFQVAEGPKLNDLKVKIAKMKGWEFIDGIGELKKTFSQEQIAKAMIEAGKGLFLAKHLDQFPLLREKQTEMALNLIKAGEVRGLLLHLENFNQADQKTIVEALLIADKKGEVMARRQKFKLSDTELRSIERKVAQRNKADLNRRVDAIDRKYAAEYDARKAAEEKSRQTAAEADQALKIVERENY